MFKKRNVEIKVDVAFSLDKDIQEVKKDLVEYIERMREIHKIYLIPTESIGYNGVLHITFEGEPITKKNKKMQDREKLTYIGIFKLWDSFSKERQKLQERLRRKYEAEYQIEVIDQVMHQGDDRVLAILVAKKLD